MSKQSPNPKNYTYTPHPLERAREEKQYDEKREEFNRRAANKRFENYKRRQENWK